MDAATIIADEVLAEALDVPRDPQALDSAVNRPDPFSDMWNKLRELTAPPCE